MPSVEKGYNRSPTAKETATITRNATTPSQDSGPPISTSPTPAQCPDDGRMIEGKGQQQCQVFVERNAEQARGHDMEADQPRPDHGPWEGAEREERGAELADQRRPEERQAERRPAQNRIRQRVPR